MSDDQFSQILRAINDVREDLREFKQDMNRRWDENDKHFEKIEKRLDEHDKHFEKIEKRLEENDNRWKENDKKLTIMNGKIDRNYREANKIFDNYEIATENMYQENKTEITEIKKYLKMASV